MLRLPLIVAGLVACALAVPTARTQVPPQQPPQPQQPRRTEEQAREAAAKNRAEREEHRRKTGAPVGLIPSCFKAVVLPVPFTGGR